MTVLTFWIQVKNRLRYDYVYPSFLYSFIPICIYMLYMQYFRDSFPSHQTLCLTRVLSLFCLCWQLSGALHEQSGVRCGLGYASRMASLGAWSRFAVIYQLYIYDMTDLYMILWDMYYSVLLMYWLYIICFRMRCLIYIRCYLFCLCIFWLLYVIPAMWDLSLVLCDSIRLV